VFGIEEGCGRPNLEIGSEPTMEVSIIYPSLQLMGVLMSIIDKVVRFSLAEGVGH
jgi:hypothetical protein